MAWYNTKKELRTTENCYNYYGSDALLFGKLFPDAGNMNLSSVFRSVELISDSIACLPILLRLKDSKHKDVDTNHPLNSVLDRHFLLIKKLMVDVLTDGNAYCYIRRDNKGDVLELRYIPQSKVTVNYNEKNNTVTYNCSLISPKKIEAINMLHFRKNTDVNNIIGNGVFKYAKKAMDLSKACDASSSNYFQNGGSISGVLTVEGQLSNQQREQIRQSWNQTFTDGGSGVAILQGNMDYKPIGSTLKDSQCLEAREYNSVELSRFFGVQPWLLGATSSVGDIEAIQLDFYLHTLLPYIQMIEDELNSKLLKPSEQFVYSIDFEDNYLIRVNKLTQANYVTTLVNNGLITLNEGRVLLGFGECDEEEMNKHHIAYVDTSKTVVEQSDTNNNKNKIEDAED